MTCRRVLSIGGFVPSVGLVPDVGVRDIDNARDLSQGGSLFEAGDIVGGGISDIGLGCARNIGSIARSRSRFLEAEVLSRRLAGRSGRGRPGGSDGAPAPNVRDPGGRLDPR
jgi:hypothetical protein